MTVANLVTEMLPFLRRYSRAAMGTPNDGDTAVERALETLIKYELDADFDTTQVDKTYIFRILQDQLSDVLGRTQEVVARHALLLTAMESFSQSQAAKILRVTADQLPQLLQLAEKELVDALATRLLIIEDEPVIAAHLQKIAESIGHKVVGIAARAHEAVNVYRSEKPDIVLADIQLADDSLGTHAVAAMNLPDTVPVIFITAYPEKMLEKKDEGPTYLITKPFQPDYVKAVISHALLRADKKKADAAASA